VPALIFPPGAVLNICFNITEQTMWWLLIPGFIIAVFLFLLLVPLRFNVNSELGWIGVRYGRLAEASLLFNELMQVIRIRIGWWRREYTLEELLRNRRPTVTAERVAQRKKKSPQPDVKKLLRKMRGVLASFRLTECEVSIDTGDMPTNGLLYPLFYFWKLRSGKNISIAFNGETVVILQAENTIARMLWAYIKS
jgi:hypothetical protein